MRRVILFILILLISSASAQEEINPDIGFGVENPQDLGITNPKIVSSLDLKFTESGTFNIQTEGSKISELNLELYSFPQEDYYLQISDLSTDPYAQSKEDAYVFNWEDLIDGETDYELTSNIKSNFGIKRLSSTQKFPFSNIPKKYEKYLGPTEKINSNDAQIKRTANEIILGEDDAYIATYKLAKFVTNEMTYDINYLGRIEPAKKVLQDKTGVCVEYSNLFIALARSVGIPARYVSGYAYGNVYGEQFNAHAWAEVYLPDVGWVPFDPTFGEFGWVDATHIKTQVSEDPTTASLRYQWTNGEISTAEPSTKVELIKKEEKLPKYISNSLWLEKAEVKPGSYNIVWMNLSNTQNFYLAPEAFLTAAPKIIGKNQKAILLKPQGTDKTGWIIEIPSDLDPGFTYTYTVVGNSIFGKEESAQFKVTYNAEGNLTLDTVKEILNVTDSTELTQDSGLSPQLNVNLQVPSEAYLDEEFNIIIDLYNSGNAPISKLKVCIENTGKNCESIFLGINDKQTLTFTNLAHEVGTKTFFMTLEGKGIEESQIIEITVVKRTFVEKILKFLNDLFDH